MDDAPEPVPARFRIADISPEPPAEIVAAITAALHEAWPQPSPPAQAVAIDTNWRFGQRRWRGRSIPRQAWGNRPNLKPQVR